MSETKTITAWLIIDWRDGGHRTRKSRPKQSDLGTNELMTKVNVEINVPDIDVPTLSAKIDVPEPRVHAATLDALADEDLPEWTETADAQIEADDVAIRQAGDGDLRRIQESIVARTLIEAPGRPDPELVGDYVERIVAEIREGDR